MTWRGPRRGFFEGPPRVLFRRDPARYVAACCAVVVLNGVVVALFGVVMVALYVDLRGDELLAFAALLTAAFAVEGLAAAVVVHRVTAPARAVLLGEDGAHAERAWSAAARVPLASVLHPGTLVLGFAGAAAAGVLLAALLDLPARDALLLLPATGPLYVSLVVLRFLGLELAMRPLLRAVPDAHLADAPRVSLLPRLIVAVPMVTWGAGVLVAGLITEDERALGPIGLAGGVAVGVSAALSIWLGLVLADAVMGPIGDLRDATRRVAGGDLDVQVPVISTDEIGELAASFNAMVAGLGERERLHDAFGAFVDPAVTERVLAEGTDLRGEEVEVSIVFVDVRDFTAFAERAGPHEVVEALDELFGAIVPLVVAHGGHANKFVGDGLLAVFGAPERHADHAARAVAAACAIAEHVRGGRLRIGVGVHSGRVVVGTVGGGGRRDFTVIGDAVNTAARVEAATRVTGDDVLVTDATLRALGGGAAAGFVERPSAPLKGKAEPVRLFAPRL
jgi:adenylate cyclase